MPTNITVISGFLGAGKTTLIKRLLDVKGFGESPALIENDYGSLGIDACVLEGTGITVKEVSAGCICCTVSGNFIEALGELLDSRQLDHLIIEPSGVGKLSDVLKLLDESTLAAGHDIGLINAITVVDAVRFAHNERYVEEYFWDQIFASNLILLNRTNRISWRERERIYRQINRCAGVKPILCEVNGRTLADLSAFVASGKCALPESGARLYRHKGSQAFLDVDARSTTFPHSHSTSHVPAHSASLSHSQPGSHAHMHSHSHSHSHPHFQWWSARLDSDFTHEGLSALCTMLEQASAYGTVYRAKGIICIDGSYQVFDFVPGEMNFQATQSQKTDGRVIVIGEELREDNLATLFSAMASCA